MPVRPWASLKKVRERRERDEREDGAMKDEEREQEASALDAYNTGRRASYDVEAGQWRVDHRDPVVGAFDQHNAWPDYDTYLFYGVDLTTRPLRALDFGCGPGRNIVKFAAQFARIDGVDLSAVNLAKAREWITLHGLPVPTLYHNVGSDLVVIPDALYDVVFSTIAMQHITVYVVRQNLLREFARVLRPGGALCIQMGYGVGHPHSVGYYENDWRPTGADTRVEDVAQVHRDVLAAGFTDFSYDIRPVGPGDRHPNWLFFRARKPPAAAPVTVVSPAE